MLLKLEHFAKKDTLVALACIVVFAVTEFCWQYQGVLGEADLHRVLVGMLDGAVTGSGINSDFHYGRDFSFGYILALYALAPADVLRDPDQLIRLINGLGLCFSIIGLFFFWLSTYIVQGSRVALVALLLFAISPVMLELGTSGHQILLAFAFLFAGASCLFLPLAGWKLILAQIAGSCLLIAGLCIRAEIFLALPFVVLASVKVDSLSTFIRSVLVNAVAPIVAFSAFLILKRHILPYTPNDGSAFFEHFYRWSNILPGTIYLSLGAGIATVIALIVIAFMVTSRISSNDPKTVKGTIEQQLISPIALILFPMAFWIANPAPSRHFLLAIAGISIVIGWAVSNLTSFGITATVLGALSLIAANQVLSEVVRRSLVSMNAARSPYIRSPEEYQTFTSAPVGFFWQHHSSLDARFHRFKDIGEMVRTSCDRDTLILSDESEHIFSRLYKSGTPIEASNSRVDEFAVFKVTVRDRHFAFVVKMTGWPKDAVATILKQPSFDNYQLYADPYFPSIYDKVAIPPNRLAKFGCKEL
jgi:hypothetical protein